MYEFPEDLRPANVLPHPAHRFARRGPFVLAGSVESMISGDIQCVLLADRHHGLTEGIRGLLGTLFDAVVMVADEPSLQESAVRLKPALAVVDLALTREDGLGVVRRLRARCPALKMILLSLHDETSACRATLEAGANAFVLKRAIATDLLPAVEAVQAGRGYVSPGVHPLPVAGGADGVAEFQKKTMEP